MARYLAYRENFSKHSKGFTLVELSIVIVIVGLIVAGVTAGRSLIKSASLRSVITDINKIKTSLNTFRMQYNAVPGDMRNAYNYWGTALGCTNQNVEINNAGCNGNGDGKWDTTGGLWTQEPFRMWQHLSHAGLWPKNFDGAVIGTGTVTVRRDHPAGAIPQTAYAPEATTGGIAPDTNHIRLLGTLGGTVGNYGAVTPAEGQNIDGKMDDGVANAGRVLAIEGTDSSGNWYSAAQCYVTTSWTLTQTLKTCRIFFLMK